MSDALPKRMKIRGGMNTGKFAGNDWWIREDGLRGLVADKVEAPYVANHGMDIKDIAGHVDRVFVAEEGAIEIPIVNGPRKGKKKPWRYVTLGHESTLSEGNQAYAEVATHILNTAKAGKVPQESFSIQVGSISYDEETDQVIFEPPLRLVHHSSVSRGAQGPDVGIGVQSIEFSAEGAAPTGSLSFSASAPAAMHVANLADAVASFSAKHAGNPNAMRAALRAGLPVVQMHVPSDPPGGHGHGMAGTWRKPSLSDFTDRQWSELSDSEKTGISRNYADATDSWTENFDDDVHLPHHDPKSGKASLNGVRNALARLSQVKNLHSPADEVRAHLQAHLPDEAESAAWGAVLSGTMQISELCAKFGLNFTSFAEEVATGADFNTGPALLEPGDKDSMTDQKPPQGNADPALLAALEGMVTKATMAAVAPLQTELNALKAERQQSTAAAFESRKAALLSQLAGSPLEAKLSAAKTEEALDIAEAAIRSAQTFNPSGRGQKPSGESKEFNSWAAHEQWKENVLASGRGYPLLSKESDA